MIRLAPSMTELINLEKPLYPLLAALRNVLPSAGTAYVGARAKT